MSVSIDSVYQTVLAITNKEQRGIITPQDFNLLAKQAQLNIFEEYFYDHGKLQQFTGTQVEFSDPLHIIEEKINIFRSSGTLSSSSLNAAVYRLGEVTYNHRVLAPTDADPSNITESEPVQVTEVTNKEFKLYSRSPLTKGTTKRPIYCRESELSIKMSPSTLIDLPSTVDYDYVRKPADPSWGYNVVLGKALYNQTRSANFELHASEETSLVNAILQMVGISIQKPEITSAATTVEAMKTQAEKSMLNKQQ